MWSKDETGQIHLKLCLRKYLKISSRLYVYMYVYCIHLENSIVSVCLFFCVSENPLTNLPQILSGELGRTTGIFLYSLVWNIQGSQARCKKNQALSACFTRISLYLLSAWEPDFVWKQSFLNKSQHNQLRTFKLSYKNIPVISQSSQIKIWGKSVTRFLSCDRTYKQTNRDYIT